MKLRSDMVCVFVARPDESGRSHEFLQLRRAANDYLGGTWQAVYGAIEPDETAVAAALRELREETGLRPLEFYRIGVAPAFYTDVNDTLWVAPTFCAIVDRQARVVVNRESDSHRWVPRQQADAMFIWSSDRSAIADICRDILDNGPAKAHLRIELT